MSDISAFYPIVGEIYEYKMISTIEIAEFSGDYKFGAALMGDHCVDDN